MAEGLEERSRLPSSWNRDPFFPCHDGKEIAFKLEFHRTHSSPAPQRRPRATYPAGQLPIGLAATLEGAVVETLPTDMSALEPSIPLNSIHRNAARLRLCFLLLPMELRYQLTTESKPITHRPGHARR